MLYRTAVVIDPNPKSARVMARALADLNIDVLGIAGYGLDAFTDVLRKNPDVVLLRAGDPFPRVTQILRGLSEAAPDRPILAYSDGATPEQLRQTIGAGATDWLAFPATSHALDLKLKDVARIVERRSVRRRQGGLGSHGGRIITVLGAQGGVGKTSVAVNLAVTLAQLDGASVALVDTDSQFGDVALALNLDRPHSTIGLAAMLDSMDAENVEDYLTDSGYGVRVLLSPGRPGSADALTPAQLKQTVFLLSQKYDYVVLDTNGSFDETLAAAITASHTAVVVTLPVRAGLNSAALALRALRDVMGEYPERMHVVLNRLGWKGGLSREDAGRALGHGIGSVIPESKLLPEALRLGIPVCAWRPKSAPSAAIRDLALRIADRGGAPPPPDARRRAGLLRVLVPRLA